jgi:hypothetical protein
LSTSIINIRIPFLIVNVENQKMAKKRKKGRGGRRPGAGAPPKGERRKVSRTVYVDPLDWDRWRTAAAKAGLGVSEWLARLANDAS